MKLITSWLRINRTLGVAVALTGIFCALLALGKAPPKASPQVSAKSSSPKLSVTPLPKIALVTSDTPSWVNEVQTKLVATGRFSQVDLIDAGSGTPTVDQLRAYKSVMVWGDSNFLDSNALGNNLADYVDGGGGVVIAVFGNTGGIMSGRFAA